MTSERQTSGVMFGTMTRREIPGSGRPESTWVQCLADDLKVFGATEGSTQSSPLLFGVGRCCGVLWPTVAKNSGKWYQGVAEAMDCLMARWRNNEAGGASYATQKEHQE